VAFVDDYGQLYEDVFPDVRSFEHFKHLHVGMLSEIKRKTLPAIARATGESDAQALHHFVANAPMIGRGVAGEAPEQVEADTRRKSVYALHR
jgi:SRSO17 transposase